MRGNTGVPNVAANNAGGQNFNFYCRSCGRVHKADVMPIMCKFCGNILLDRGFGISGDNALSETTDLGSDYGRRGPNGTITDIDSPVR